MSSLMLQASCRCHFWCIDVRDVTMFLMPLMCGMHSAMRTCLWMLDAPFDVIDVYVASMLPMGCRLPCPDVVSMFLMHFPICIDASIWCHRCSWCSDAVHSDVVRLWWHRIPTLCLSRWWWMRPGRDGQSHPGRYPNRRRWAPHW